MYTPKDPFIVPFNLLVPTKGKTLGQVTKVFVASESSPMFCSFKTFGGTEVIIDNILSVQNTGVIESWWTPDFSNDCQIQFLDDMSTWEILNVENIDRRNMYARLKVRYIGGGA